ncbi:hypothetical protein scyTo_0023227 [Scyliorhinus torazame]|uniref:Uncharacterized protein n=1 Tax=Scyliorhinus torazame TaxID=75743 RepID=A0A401Q5S2_SCYTO|nr:hypothetical protein [Scyliorhinus torazame]
MQEKLKALVWKSAAYQQKREEVESLWKVCGQLMYSLDDRQKQLGLGAKGISTYFSGNCELKDAELAQKFLDSKGISAYNTRLFKTAGTDDKPLYEVRQASAIMDVTDPSPPALYPSVIQ